MQTAKQTPQVASVKPLSEDQAAQAMWLYYRDNKARLVSHVREYRDAILSQLMAGAPVEGVFAPYLRPIEQVKPLRRAA